MVIAVDTRGAKDYRHFIYESFRIITAKLHQHNFVFISDQPLDQSFTFSENIIPVVFKQAKFTLLSRLKMASLLKKYKADVLVTAQTLKTNVPQCLIAFDKFSEKSLNGAQTIVTGSEFFREEIIEKYKIDEKKIEVVYKGIDEIFTPLAFDEREKIKERYADGHEYFLCTVNSSTGNLLNLLKAFSIFKKLQKSNMQLLILFHTGMNKEFSEALQLYKFKSEVKILENTSKEELAKITAGSYAFIYPFINEDYLPVLQAMKCDVPVITYADEQIMEVCSDGAIYFSGNDHKEMADKMMLIYKDENLRHILIEKGRGQVKNYNWERAAEQLWQTIQKAAN